MGCNVASKCKLPLIIFAHIEKTGGTSLNGILRAYHGIHYAHIRALHHAGPPKIRAVHANDLNLYLRLAPWLRCVSGHAVRPWVLLNEGVSSNLFLTIIREPIERYVSYYTYGGGIKRRPWPYSFEEYLNIEEFHNYQTKRIVGRADAMAAMKIIRESFLAAAVLESMDKLIDKLDTIWSGIKYVAARIGRRNVQSNTGRERLIERYYDAVIENNKEDILLYNMLKEEFDGIFFKDEVIKKVPENQGEKDGIQYTGVAREAMAVLMRRIYLTPITGMVRIMHGLPFGDTY